MALGLAAPTLAAMAGRWLVELEGLGCQARWLPSSKQHKTSMPSFFSPFKEFLNIHLKALSQKKHMTSSIFVCFWLLT